MTESTEKPGVMNAIRIRRSVREYLDRPVEGWKLELILEAARLAPSGENLQSWHFVVVRDQATIKDIANSTPPLVARLSKWLASVPVVIAVCGKPHLLLQRAANVLGKNYFEVDIGIAGEHLVLQAAELGLGTCWVGAFSEKRVKKILGIPQMVRCVALMAVGYPKVRAKKEGWKQEELGLGNIKQRPRKSMDEIVSYERYGRSK